MRWILASAIAWLCVSIAASPAEARCGNRKVDASIRRTCAPCVAGSTNCPCADVRTPLEPCDGRDFDGATCQTQGFFAGNLRCTATCTLDTSRCTKLTSDLEVKHRTVGAAASNVTLAFATNVISVGATNLSTTTITPYNWDLRGPWGKASKIAGYASVAAGTLALARKGTALELVGIDYQGGAKTLHAFGDRRALASAPGFRGGTLVALESGRGTSELVRLDDAGKQVGTSQQLAGEVRALSWHQEGFVVAFADRRGDLRVAWLGDDGGLVAERSGFGTAPRWVAIAPLHPMRALVVRNTADSVVASIVTLDKTEGLDVEADLTLLASSARVVAAGYAGSTEGNYVILDDNKGQILAARIHDGKATVKRVIDQRGAVAYAATTGYQQIYVAWTYNKKLHLSSFSAFLAE